MGNDLIHSVVLSALCFSVLTFDGHLLNVLTAVVCVAKVFAHWFVVSFLADVRSE